MGRDLANRVAQQTGNAPAQRPKTLADDVKAMEKQFALAMPKGAEATQLVRDALTCLQQTRDLARCEKMSVLGSLMTCAQLGLRPGVLGHAWLLPFWDKRIGGHRAQIVIGYQGFVELAYRSGKVLSIAARTVYENDVFELEYGMTEDRLIHKPALSGAAGEPRLFYALARLKDGGYAMTRPMTVADMEAYRDEHATARNKQGKIVGPWVDNFEGMAHKTVVRQLMKLLPKSTDMARAESQDEGIRLDTTVDGIDVQPIVVDAEPDDEPSDPAGKPETSQVVDGVVEDESMEYARAAQDIDQSGPISKSSIAIVNKLLGQSGITDRDARIRWLQDRTGRADVKYVQDLTVREGNDVIEFLEDAINNTTSTPEGTE